jgi:L-threonylcarbamoyladenylate synthase
LRALLLGSDTKSITAAAEIVRGGGVVAYPTDTVYGLGCDPFSAGAVARLVEAKERDSKPVPVLCSARGAALKLVELGPLGLELARRYWPGALTIVAPLKREVPELLDQGSGWLGVRIPDDQTALGLARSCGGAITGTSANLSGRPSSRTAGEVAGSLGDRIDAILDGGPRTGKESTVVRVNGTAVEVLRRGAVAFESGIT